MRYGARGLFSRYGGPPGTVSTHQAGNLLQRDLRERVELQPRFLGDVVLVDGIAQVVLRFHQRRARITVNRAKSGGLNRPNPSERCPGGPATESSSWSRRFQSRASGLSRHKRYTAFLYASHACHARRFVKRSTPLPMAWTEHPACLSELPNDSEVGAF